MAEKQTITMAIQAGGRSSRMGQDKGLVPLAGRPMIEHVLARVAGLGDEILITTNNPAGYAYLGVRLVSDAAPGAGALPGLHTALTAARGDVVVVLACDMPFANRGLLAYMLTLAPAADVIVPIWQDNYQPMQAVYARERALAAVAVALARGQKRMISFYDQVRVRAVMAAEIMPFDADGLTFFNVNTPAELAQAEASLAAIKSAPHSSNK
ncbi:MAG: molybdenum cofactor guanylyltransferase [Ardenticatenales bacterium]|nr:molybdenum cofactor guanylyltransferase [Ardenticatenales bacterium]